MAFFLLCSVILFADTQPVQKNVDGLEKTLERYESVIEQVLNILAMRKEALQEKKKEEDRQTE